MLGKIMRDFADKKQQLALEEVQAKNEYDLATVGRDEAIRILVESVQQKESAAAETDAVLSSTKKDLGGA